MMTRFIDRFKVVLVVCSMVLLSGCSAPAGEGFAIYLTKNDVPPAKIETFSHVDLADKPIISVDDVISYDDQSHEIVLTDAAYERIIQLAAPMSGKSFLVCLDKNPIYRGAFWVDLSSQSFNGVTISKPLSPEDSKVITLELGYPSPTFFTGDDPRNDEAVLNSLEKSGKLIKRP